MNSVVDIRGVRDQLRPLLGLTGRERSAASEGQVARAVGLLSVDYPVQGLKIALTPGRWELSVT